jgi:hypothetical protein
LEETNEQMINVNKANAQKESKMSSLRRVMSNLETLTPQMISSIARRDTLLAEQQRVSTQSNNAIARYKIDGQLQQVNQSIEKMKLNKKDYLDQYTKLLIGIGIANKDIKQAIKDYEKALEKANIALAELGLNTMMNLFDPSSSYIYLELPYIEDPLNSSSN